MHTVHHAIEQRFLQLPTISVVVSRHVLCKRRWRAQARDGTDFGFDLESPLKHGETIFRTAKTAYVIEQEPEPLLLLRFGSCREAATIAWQIGNLHFPAAIEEGGLLVEDDIAIRQMLDRQQISYTAVEEIFQPLSAAPAHRHQHQDSHDSEEDHAHTH